MNNTAKENRQFSIAKVVIILVSTIITGFYLVSAFGWFMATYFMARSGTLGIEATNFYQSLNLIDHIMRSSQVLLIVIASILLLFFRRIALKLLLVSIILSLVSTALVGKWGISFLGGLFGLLLLIVIYGYAFFLNRRGFLH